MVDTKYILTGYLTMPDPETGGTKPDEVYTRDPLGDPSYASQVNWSVDKNKPGSLSIDVAGVSYSYSSREPLVGEDREIIVSNSHNQSADPNGVAPNINLTLARTLLEKAQGIADEQIRKENVAEANAAAHAKGISPPVGAPLDLVAALKAPVPAAPSPQSASPSIMATAEGVLAVAGQAAVSALTIASAEAATYVTPPDPAKAATAPAPAVTKIDAASVGREYPSPLLPYRGSLKGIALTGYETKELRDALRDPHNLGEVIRAQAVLEKHGINSGADNHAGKALDGIEDKKTREGIEEALGIHSEHKNEHEHKHKQKPHKHRDHIAPHV